MSSVVVADASAFVRLGIASALRDGGLTVAAEVSTAAAAITAALAHRARAVLVDLDLDHELSAVASMAAALPDAALIVIAADESPALALRVLQGGACGLVPRHVPLERLPAIVQGAIDGEAVLSRTQMRGLLPHLRLTRGHAGTPLPDGTRLTAREREVLELMAAGLADHRIAGRLGLSPVTVRRHAAAAKRKLQAARREDALARFRDAVA